MAKLIYHHWMNLDNVDMHGRYKNNKRISAGGGKAGGGGSSFWIEERWGLDDNDEEGGGGEGKHQRTVINFCGDAIAA